MYVTLSWIPNPARPVPALVLCRSPSFCHVIHTMTLEGLLVRCAVRSSRAWSAGRRFYSAARVPHLTLFSGTHCELCEYMKESINEVRADAPHTLTVYNIRDDDEPNVKYWRRKFQYDIPVLYLRRDAPTHADDYDKGACADEYLHRNRTTPH